MCSLLISVWGERILKGGYCIFTLKAREKLTFGMGLAVYQRAVLTYQTLPESVNRHIRRKNNYKGYYKTLDTGRIPVISEVRI